MFFEEQITLRATDCANLCLQGWFQHKYHITTMAIWQGWKNKVLILIANQPRERERERERERGNSKIVSRHLKQFTNCKRRIRIFFNFKGLVSKFFSLRQDNVFSSSTYDASSTNAQHRYATSSQRYLKNEQLQELLNVVVSCNFIPSSTSSTASTLSHQSQFFDI